MAILQTTTVVCSIIYGSQYPVSMIMVTKVLMLLLFGGIPSPWLMFSSGSKVASLCLLHLSYYYLGEVTCSYWINILVRCGLSIRAYMRQYVFPRALCLAVVVSLL